MTEATAPSSKTIRGTNAVLFRLAFVERTGEIPPTAMIVHDRRHRAQGAKSERRDRTRRPPPRRRRHGLTQSGAAVPSRSSAGSCASGFAEIAFPGDDAMATDG